MLQPDIAAHPGDNTIVIAGQKSPPPFPLLPASHSAGVALGLRLVPKEASQPASQPASK